MGSTSLPLRDLVPFQNMPRLFAVLTGVARRYLFVARRRKSVLLIESMGSLIARAMDQSQPNSGEGCDQLQKQHRQRCQPRTVEPVGYPNAEHRVVVFIPRGPLTRFDAINLFYEDVPDNVALRQNDKAGVLSGLNPLRYFGQCFGIRGVFIKERPRSLGKPPLRMFPIGELLELTEVARRERLHDYLADSGELALHRNLEGIIIISHYEIPHSKLFQSKLSEAISSWIHMPSPFFALLSRPSMIRILAHVLVS